MSKELKNINRSDIYDLYVKQYNDSDKLSATALFITIVDGYKKQLSNIEEELNGERAHIKQEMEKIEDKPDKSVLEQITPERWLEVNLNKTKECLFNHLEDVKAGIVQSYSKQIIPCENHFEEFFKHVKGFSIPGWMIEQFYIDAIHLCDKHFKTMLHIHVLNSIIQDIIDKSYPDNLKMWEELTINEKKQLQGIAATNSEKFNKRLEKHWPLLKPAIFKAMDKKQFSEIFKKGQTVGNEFTQNVYNKFDDIPLDTLKKWLDRKDVRYKIRKAYQSETKPKPH